MPLLKLRDIQGGGSHGNFVQTGQGFFVITLYDGIVFNFNSTMQVHNASVTLLKSATSKTHGLDCS